MIRTALTLALIAGPAAALELSLPVDCDTDAGCYIQNYFDHDSGLGIADYTCGPLSYDGHMGTDIRVPTMNDLKRGIEIRAAAAGRVRAVRNGEPDTGNEFLTPGRECGNGVTIDHADGWTTQYCHLENGSLLVAPDQPVKTGQAIGKMGFSGATTFPHLHIALTRRGSPVDPFHATSTTSGCTTGSRETLWSAAALEVLRYQPGGIVDTGLSNSIPTLEQVRQGLPVNTARTTGDAMVFWLRFFGLRKGDEIAFGLINPAGETVAVKKDVMTRNRAEEFRYIGKRGQVWPAGEYLSFARIRRSGEIVEVMTGRFQVR